MNVTLTARHCEISDGLRRRVDTLAQRLTRYGPRVAGVDLVFEKDSGQNRVEALARVEGRRAMVASATGESLRVALDRAMDKLARQVRRGRERHVDHQAAKSSIL